MAKSDNCVGHGPGRVESAHFDGEDAKHNVAGFVALYNTFAMMANFFVVQNHMKEIRKYFVFFLPTLV